MSSPELVKRHLSEEKLTHRLRSADTVTQMRRLGFLKNLYQGDSVTEAIHREGFSQSTGYRWRKQWNEGGIEALAPDHGGGRPPKLTASDETAFLEIIHQRQPLTTAEIESILHSEFDVEYTSEYLPQKLSELGLEYQQPDREKATRKALISEVEWDNKDSVPTRCDDAYDKHNSESGVGWILPK